MSESYLLLSSLQYRLALVCMRSAYWYQKNSIEDCSLRKFLYECLYEFGLFHEASSGLGKRLGFSKPLNILIRVRYVTNESVLIIKNVGMVELIGRIPLGYFFQYFHYVSLVFIQGSSSECRSVLGGGRFDS